MNFLLSHKNKLHNLQHILSSGRVMQLILVVADVFGQPIGLIFKGQAFQDP